MLEKYLIEHCSPTLASLKSANLFSIDINELKKIENEITRLNNIFWYKGIELIVLNENGNRSLVYVYRKNKLQEDLNKAGVGEFLKVYDYKSTDVNYAINLLKERIKIQNGFPHEIGIFLGYPLGDVIGFIKNNGKNSKCSGCWKVYCDECKAKEMFAKFEKCKVAYKKLWSTGKNIEKLAVAA